MKENFEAPSYAESLANEILAKYRRLDTVLTHAPSKGSYHESILRSMLKEYLPQSFSVGEGFILGKDGRVGSQVDILVVDSLDPRSFGFKQDNFFIANQLSVCSFGEVKTKPNRKEFIESFHKLVDNALLIEFAGRVTSFLFCYDAPVTNKTFFNWVNKALDSFQKPGDVKTWHLPDFIFCLKKNAMLERKSLPDGSVQYFSVEPNSSDSNAVKVKIIRDIIACITNGCGRLRKIQGINIAP